MNRYIQHILSLVAAAATVALCFLSTSCNSSTSSKPIIAVSIQPQKFLLEKIVGENFDILCLLSQGSNPETYEPSMNHLVNLEKSEAYFTIGNIGFEMAIVDKARKNNPNLKFYNNSEGISLIRGSHEGIAEIHAEHGHHHEIDPHVWTSVVNAKIIATNMCNAVCELDAKHSTIYKKRLAKLLSELDNLNEEMKAQLAPLRGKAFIVWHPSLSYFARDYGMKQISMEFEGKEIPAKYLKEEIDSARACGAKVFFFQKEFDSRQVESVNEQVGAQLVTINPMNYNWEAEIKNIANALASAENN